MNGMAARLAKVYPDNERFGVAIVSMRDGLTGGLRTPLLALPGALGMVMLRVCVNIANLQDGQAGSPAARARRTRGTRRIARLADTARSWRSRQWTGSTMRRHNPTQPRRNHNRRMRTRRELSAEFRGGVCGCKPAAERSPRRRPRARSERGEPKGIHANVVEKSDPNRNRTVTWEKRGQPPEITPHRPHRRIGSVQQRGYGRRDPLVSTTRPVKGLGGSRCL
jgi:hypothetical protein